MQSRNNFHLHRRLVSTVFSSFNKKYKSIKQLVSLIKKRERMHVPERERETLAVNLVNAKEFHPFFSVHNDLLHVLRLLRSTWTKKGSLLISLRKSGISFFPAGHLMSQQVCVWPTPPENITSQIMR
jgi:hypothetical protein